MSIKSCIRRCLATFYYLFHAIKYKGSIKRKIKYFCFTRLLQRKGVVLSRIDRVADLYTKDFFDYKGTSLLEKKWAYKHGFSSYKMSPWYGVSASNYKNYISDFDFYSKKNYISKTEISSWFENKMNTYYLLAPFKKYMPRHYYSILDGRVMPIDVDKKGDGSIDDIISLIEERPIAAKACHGGHGVGFYKLSFDGDSFWINGKASNRERLRDCLSSLNDYIITEYCSPNDSLAELAGNDAFSVLRVITVFDKEDGPQVTCVIIRLGCRVAGITSDYDGTIYCGLTLDEGRFFKPLYRVSESQYDLIHSHPDTGKALEGFVLPDFSKLKNLSIQVSRYLPFTPYLVMDIIPSREGFKILEINSHGQVRIVEPFYPFCANEYNRRVFHIE